ncbi:hypothetical protein EON65_12600 [archaeon]|nr:MAG: hypothetical protein EON65_12600 [archaeon]
MVNGEGREEIFDGLPLPPLLVFLACPHHIHAQAQSGGVGVKGRGGGPKDKKGRPLRVQVGGWMEVSLSELHLALLRGVQRGIDSLFEERVRGEERGLEGEAAGGRLTWDERRNILCRMIKIMGA